MRYRRKALEVDAIRVTEAVYKAAHNWKSLPSWVRESYEDANGAITVFTPQGVHVKVAGLDMLAGLDEWILRDADGQIFPCEPDRFAKWFEVITDEAVLS